MKYSLIIEAIRLIEEFDSVRSDSSLNYTHDIDGFKLWIASKYPEKEGVVEPEWEGKDSGRSPESVISTLFVHLNRYAKMYSKAAMHGSDFSTQEEFIYLINLRAFGEMTKMELIKKNIQDKPAGMQIISRLIKQGWVEQQPSEVDRRSKIIRITGRGELALDTQMDKIRKATTMVAGNLTYMEKMELIRLLHKLDRFHHPIFSENIESEELLDRVLAHSTSI